MTHLRTVQTTLLITLAMFTAAATGCNQTASAGKGEDKAANGAVEEKAAPETKKIVAFQPIVRPATVLLVSPDSLEAAWRPFADWKTRCGKPTKIVTISQIEKQYQGDDLQQKIRACVLAHVESDKTRWVVLGGDSEPDGKGLVPDRDTLHRELGYADIPTDLYYISETDWDANDDGIYGDWRKDREAISYTGKACIGRIPVRTAADVAAYTEKVIGYETKFPTRNFATNFTYTCAVPFADYKSDMYWDRYLSKAWPAGRCDKFFNKISPWDKDEAGDYDLSPANWVERINTASSGKMHMHGHGLLKLWVLEGGTVDADTIGQLKNRDAYLVMTTVSCFTGHYDAADDPCVAEAMLRAPQAGAVVVCAPSRPGVPIFHDWARDPKDGKTQDGTTRTYTRFWVNGLSKNLTTGEAFAAAKADLADDARKSPGFHWCQCELNLLGDPTLDMRANDPVKLKVTVPKTVSTGAGSITVQVGRPGMTVCLWKGDEVYTVAKTGTDGTAKVDVHPRTTGKLLITVAGPSANTYVGEIAVE